MIHEAVNEYVRVLAQYTDNRVNGFITSLEGLVRAAEIKQTGPDGKPQLLRLPVALQEAFPDYDACSAQDYFRALRLVPDQKKRCIIFFEAGPAPVTQTLPSATRFNARLSLLCWYNRLGFSFPRNRLESLLTAKLLAILKAGVYGMPGDVLQYEMATATFVPGGPAIFGGYSFSDMNSGYFSDPFGCFKLEFNLKLSLNESCTSDLLPIAFPGCP